MSDTPLQGVRVLDAARGVAGSYAACLLGDLGADVVKVEEPGAGDPLRGQPPLLQGGESAAFITFNRNKRGITLQLGHPKGRKIFGKLIETSDVLIHDLRPALLRALGAGRASLKEVRPGLVTCSVTPYGTTGPYAEMPGSELVIQAKAGLLPGVEPEGEPARTVSLRVAEVAAGLHAALGVVAVLRKGTEEGDGGRDLEVSSYESLISLMGCSVLATRYAAEEVQEKCHEAAWSPAGVFPTKDDPIALVASSERAWRQICSALELEDLPGDPRFMTNAERIRNREEVNRLLGEKLRERPAAEWVEELTESGVAASHVSSPWEIMTDPHLAERELIGTVHHTLLGDIKMVRGPIRIGAGPGKLDRSAPLLGEHNGEVLGQLLGYSPADLKRLRGEKII